MSKINAKVCDVCLHACDSSEKECPVCQSCNFATDEELEDEPVLETMYFMRKAPDRHEMQDPDDPVYMMAYKLVYPDDEIDSHIANISIANISTLVNTCIQIAAADESIRRDIFLDSITVSLNSLCERAKFDRAMNQHGSN